MRNSPIDANGRLIDAREVAARTSPEVLNDWDAYLRCEPFGNEVEMMAKIAWQIRAYMCAKAGTDPGEHFDFMPWFDIHHKEKPKQSAEELARERYPTK